MLTYEQIREIAADGDIIFLKKSRNIVERLVSWATRSPYTHVAFVFWYNQRLLLIESTIHGGIRIVQASVYSDRQFDIIPCPQSWNYIESIALERSGTASYGWFSALYIGLREILFTHFDISLPQNKDNRNKACSEFIAEVLDLHDVDVSPGKLYSMLKKD